MRLQSGSSLKRDIDSPHRGSWVDASVGGQEAMQEFWKFNNAISCLSDLTLLNSNMALRGPIFAEGVQGKMVAIAALLPEPHEILTHYGWALYPALDPRSSKYTQWSKMTTTLQSQPDLESLLPCRMSCL
jgi:hypothetical protein